MDIKKTKERMRLADDQPRIHEPVNARMDCLVYYQTERGPVIWDHAFYCERVFAETVLQSLDSVMNELECSLVHIGCFNPRLARTSNGNIILPKRWSNHAYGQAIDFKGICQGLLDFTRPKYCCYRQMIKANKDLIKDRCSEAITRAGKRPEIVDEYDWLHIGIWPERR